MDDNTLIDYSTTTKPSLSLMTQIETLSQTLLAIESMMEAFIIGDLINIKPLCAQACLGAIGTLSDKASEISKEIINQL